MHETTIDRFIVPVPESRDVMTEILRAGAQKMLADMIQQEVEDWLAQRAHLRDEQGRRQVVRNGYLPEREITTGVGPVKVKQPRVRDRRPAGPGGAVYLEDPAAVPEEDQEHRGVDSLAVPQGRQHGRLQRGPEGPVGAGCPGAFGDDGHPPEGRLGGGIPGVEQAVPGRQAVRVRVGGRRAFQHPPGRRPAVHPGAHGSHGRGEEGADRRRGRIPGERAVVEGLALGREGPGPGDGPEAGDRRRGLGLLEGFASRSMPNTREQRCWVHKTANVLDKLPKRLQAEAKQKLHEIWMADTREHAERGVRPVREDLRGEVPQGGRVPGEGSGRPAGLLRLPGGALDSPADDQPHRVHLRHGATTHQEDQGERFSHGLPDDGLQADGIRLQEMEAAQRLASRSPKSSEEPSSSTESSPNKSPPEEPGRAADAARGRTEGNLTTEGTEEQEGWVKFSDSYQNKTGVLQHVSSDPISPQTARRPGPGSCVVAVSARGARGDYSL